MRARGKAVVGVLLLGLAVGLGLLFQVLRYGLSAHDEPTRVEHVLARTMRRYATPADLRGRKNQVPLTPGTRVIVTTKMEGDKTIATEVKLGPRSTPKASASTPSPHH